MPEIEESIKKFPQKSISHHIPNATHVAVDLIRKMLEVSPHKRIALDEALIHPFFVPKKEQYFDDFDDFGFSSPIKQHSPEAASATVPKPKPIISK